MKKDQSSSRLRLTLRRYKWRKKQAPEIWAHTHTHTSREKESSERERICQNILITHAAVIRTHHVTCLTRIQTTREPEWKSEPRKTADEGTVATKVEAHVSLRPLYWQWWQRSPGRPLSRTRLRTSNLRWHTQRERKPELRAHRYTVSPWFVKTRTYSESTQAQRASRFKRWRREGRPGRERAPEPRPISASVYINLSLLLCETEHKTLWREDKSRGGSSEPLWSHSNW